MNVASPVAVISMGHLSATVSLPMTRPSPMPTIANSIVPMPISATRMAWRKRALSDL